MAVTECMDSGQIIGLAKYFPMLGRVAAQPGHYAATKFPWEEEIPVSGNVFAPGREFVRREPIGVCVGIVPWNFPMTMAFWKIAPALIMGNTIVLKPASNTPLSALILAEAAKAAGIPKGVINVIPGPGGELGKVLCTHPDVDKIAFTGSTEVGREIMRMASDTVKKVTLELGGKSANIILDDADMDLAVEGACFGTFFHQGQICESGTRVLVPSKIYDEFVEKMKKRAEALRDRLPAGLRPPTWARWSARSNWPPSNATSSSARKRAPKLITGGKRVEVPGIKGGYYYAPTIFANVNNKMRIAQEEIFGPVVCVIKYDSDEEAVAIANDSIYGLAGGVFSSNIARAERVARRVRTGTMWINNYHVFADYCPFGGYKQSGVGRELGMGAWKSTRRSRESTSRLCADREIELHLPAHVRQQEVDGFSLQLPDQRDRRPRLPVGSIYKAVVDLGCKRALILTDPGVRKAGLADLVKNALVDFCVGIYDKIPPGPRPGIRGRRHRDGARAQGGLHRQRRRRQRHRYGQGGLRDPEERRQGQRLHQPLVLTEPQTPHIVVPTTAGTGSEVTNVAVITSKGAGRKLFIVDPRIMPNAAILDPRFTMTLPKGLTVDHGHGRHDARRRGHDQHHGEPDLRRPGPARHTSDQRKPAAGRGRRQEREGPAQHADSGHHGRLGIYHRPGRPGARHGPHGGDAVHHVPHGAACGIVLPKVMRYNVDHATDKLALVAQALGVDTAGMNERDAALAAADAVEALMKKVGPSDEAARRRRARRRACGICAFHAIADTAVLFNARPVNDPGEVLELYKQAY